MLPLAKVKVPPSQNTGQYQQEGVGKGRPRLAQGGHVLSCLPLWPPWLETGFLQNSVGLAFWGCAP